MVADRRVGKSFQVFVFLVSVSIQPIYYAVTGIRGDPPFHFRRVLDLRVS